MLCAAIQDCPVFGGKLVSFDEATVAGLPGVRRVVRVNDTTVAVVADTWWHAKTALAALPIVWDEGPNASRSSAMIADQLKEGLMAQSAYAYRKEGDAPKAIEGAAKKVEAVSARRSSLTPPMEPMSCTVKFTADGAEVWMPTQNAERRAALSAPACRSKMRGYKFTIGGGWRRNSSQDYVVGDRS
jgi:isoquinoline 1-oxidoreductase beta subunit